MKRLYMKTGTEISIMPGDYNDASMSFFALNLSWKY